MYPSAPENHGKQRLLVFFAVQSVVAVFICFILKIVTFSDIERTDIKSLRSPEINRIEDNDESKAIHVIDAVSLDFDAVIVEQSKQLVDDCRGVDRAWSCGLETCWNQTTRSISTRCKNLFDIEVEENSSRVRYFRKDFSHMHQQPRRFPRDNAMQASNFSLVLDFFCFGPGFNVYESLTECFVRHMVLLAPLLNSPAPLPSVAVLPGYMLRYMEIVCKLLETRAGSFIFLLFSTHQNQVKRDGLTCLSHHHATRTALELTPGYLPWRTYYSNEDPMLGVNLPARNRLAWGLAHRALGARCGACASIVVLCRYWSRVIIDQVGPPFF